VSARAPGSWITVLTQNIYDTLVNSLEKDEKILDKDPEGCNSKLIFQLIEVKLSIVV
jgi:hypothetical protein